MPTAQPSPLPTAQPSPLPTQQPSPLPTAQPTPLPTFQPTPLPTAQPTPLPTPAPSAYDCRFGYVDLTCGDQIVSPLFLNLSAPEHAALVGPNFGADGRSAEVAVFRFAVPSLAGYTSTIIVETCDPQTTFGTLLSAYDECPDPWAASAQANYKDRAIGVSDDAPECATGALAADGVTSRASRIEAIVDSVRGTVALHARFWPVQQGRRRRLGPRASL